MMCAKEKVKWYCILPKNPVKDLLLNPAHHMQWKSSIYQLPFGQFWWPNKHNSATDSSFYQAVVEIENQINEGLRLEFFL